MNPTAAIIIIGDEILSGRTLDTNTQVIALKLGGIGIDLQEVRSVRDVHDVIVSAVNELRAKYEYVFTTGGIGPTHDDITSEAIADAFGVKCEVNSEAYKIIKAHYNRINQELNPAREKMAYLPEGSKLIENPVSAAPGFILGNVYVMAGVPHIMKAMLDQVLPQLQHGSRVESRSIEVMIGESLIAKQFSDLQNKYKDVAMGSYPFEIDNKHGTSLVLRSTNLEHLEKAYSELKISMDMYKAH